MALTTLAAVTFLAVAAFLAVVTFLAADLKAEADREPFLAGLRIARVAAMNAWYSPNSERTRLPFAAKRFGARLAFAEGRLPQKLRT